MGREREVIRRCIEKRLLVLVEQGKKEAKKVYSKRY